MALVVMPKVRSESERITKPELHEVADSLLLYPEPSVVERAVKFVLAETQGLWHGRARAMMCRRLKHCSITPAQSTRLVSCITHRLFSGTFSEQFKDQLRLVMHLDLRKALNVSAQCADSPKAHVRRYAQWVLSHEQSRSAP
jgi:hypothetical protein